MKILLVHPGASWSTADVEAGLRYGLEYHGVNVVQFRLDGRIENAGRWLHSQARRARKTNPDIPKPTKADVMYHAGTGVLERALRHQVDVVLVVSGMYFHPDLAILLKRAHIPVTVLFTESPYDIEKELALAKIVDGCWTMERSCVDDFRRANQRSGYIPHGWHPQHHHLNLPVPPDTPSHDVIFVGSCFRERIAFLTTIDWTGIDFGLYGIWDGLPPRHPLRRHLVKNANDSIGNDYAAVLYQQAKISLNLYRHSKGFGREAPFITHAESMSPRGYELAACGAFHLSEYRQEVEEMFGELVPTFRTPAEASALIRRWLKDEAGRRRLAEQLPARVAESSWVERATRVIGDLQSLLGTPSLAESVS